MNDKEIEIEIIEKNMTAPRITLGQIDSIMEQVLYEFWIVPNTTTTICVSLVPMLGGMFTAAVGKSAAVSKDNFDTAIGRKIAQTECERATRDKLWELEGYWLKKNIGMEPKQ